MNVATKLAVFEQAIGASLTVMTLPTGVTASQVGELWLSSTASWSFSNSASGTEFPVPADTIVRMPYNQALYLKNSAAISIAVFGWPAGT